MVVYSGGDGAQTFTGTSGADTIYGYGSVDTNALSGRITAVSVATGLAAPIFGASTAADSGAIYMLEKDEGRIVRVDLSSGQKSTFLDIPNTDISAFGERGLLGMAFHPDYASNGRIFVFVTQPNGDLQVREYASAGGNPPVANATLVQTIITIPHPSFSNHNGGSLAFGPDGYLYISTGDGGGGGDPNNNAQNTNSLLGKILRLDVNSDGFPTDASRNYAIPSDNPFVGVAGADEIWDYGLRNPWRISFDAATGDLWIGDVGQGRIEEVDVHRADVDGGLNFGWRIFEGDLPYTGTGTGPFEDPIHVYNHSVGQSVTGGFVYRGPDPGLQGSYVFADFVTGKIWALIQRGTGVEVVDLSSRIAPGGLGNISSFGVGADGELYIVAYSGSVYRLDMSAAAGDGNDVLSGGGGADRIHGGAGDDTLSGDAGDDSVFGGLGDDKIYGGSENDSLLGDYGSDNIMGWTGHDTLLGGNDRDSVNGGEGNDRIFGGLGLDVLTGGNGVDWFFFNTNPATPGNRDTILDFNPVQDTIRLENAVFTALTVTGTLSATAFKIIGQGAIDADDRIIYDPSNGSIFYDSDGSGAGLAIHFASLAGAPTITAADFVIY